MNSASSNLLSEASLSRYIKFKVQGTWPSGSKLKSWKSRSKLSVFAVYV